MAFSQLLLGHVTSVESPVLWFVLLLGFVLGYCTAWAVPRWQGALSRQSK